MAGIIFTPKTLFSLGVSRQFGGSTNPPNLSDPATGNGGQPIFKGYVTLSESSVDAIEITKQPVQQGAQMSDHAFKKPTTLSISILFGASILPSIDANGIQAPQSLETIYQNLLALQSSFQPFNCTTPKRTYYNMLLATLGVTTDKNSENILSVNASFEQIITVPVGITTVSRSQLSNPGRSGGTQSAGTKSLQSVAKSGWNALTGVK